MKLQIRKYECGHYKGYCLTDNEGRGLPAQESCDLYYEDTKLIYGEDAPEIDHGITAVITFIMGNKNEIKFMSDNYSSVNNHIDNWDGPLRLNIRRSSTSKPTLDKHLILTDTKGNQLPNQMSTNYKSFCDDISRFTVKFWVTKSVSYVDEIASF